MPFANTQGKPLPVNGKWKIDNGTPGFRLTQEAKQTSQTSELRSQIWRRRRPGFSLVEMIVTIFLIAIISTILITSTNSLHTRRRTDLSALAGKIASSELERVRNLEFSSIAPYSNRDCSSEFIQSSSPTYLPNCQISQTVYCYPLAGADPNCIPNPNVKQVSITIQLKYHNKTKTAVVETLISSGGL